jgi:L-alanine-DL-glutamate epimerase-like enolase superfamily enzyme
MRVASVRLDVLEIPFRETLVAGDARWLQVRPGLLRLGTDGGIEGLAEAVADGLTLDLSSALEAALVGLDVEDESSIEERLGTVRAWPVVGSTLGSAVASALVDARARAAGRSAAAWLADGPGAAAVRSLARPPASGVAVNALLGIAAPEAAATEARRIVGEGFGCLKLKGGAEAPGVLLRRVSAVRESVGPAVSLRLDLNGALDEASAASLLDALAPLELDYVEQPVPVGAGVGALARLRRRGRTPIGADEAVIDIVAADALVSAGAVDVIVVKAARVGGLVQAARIIDLALSCETRVTVATFFESGVGVASALHLAALVPGEHAHGLSTAGLLASDLLAEALPLRGGRMMLPSGVGLGIAIDQLAVERYRVGGVPRHA